MLVNSKEIIISTCSNDLCKLLENSPGQEYPVPPRQNLVPMVGFSALLVALVQMPLPARKFVLQDFCVLYHSGLASWNKAMKCRSLSVCDDSMTVERSYSSWPHLKAYADCAFRESAAGTARPVHWDAAHMLVHLVVARLAFLLPNPRRSCRATRPTQKVPPQMRLSDHVDVKQIKRNDSQFDHPNTSQKMMPGFSKRYCQAWFTWNAPFEEKHGNTISHPQKIWRKVTFKKKWQALGLLGLLVWA